MADPSTWCDPTPPEPLPPPGSLGSGADRLVAAPQPWQAPQLRPGLLSQLGCSYGWRPILITGLIRDLLIQHFAEPGLAQDTIFRLAAEQGRPNTWREGTDTGILIESIHRWRGELVGLRPAVIIKRNSYSGLRLGLGDRVRVDGRGFQTFSKLWVGSHTVFCLHGSGAGVELLSCEVKDHLDQNSQVITEYLGLLRWQVTEVGPISEIEESKETFVVPVTVGWAFQSNWTLELESPKLRRVTLATLLQF